MVVGLLACGGSDRATGDPKSGGEGSGAVIVVLETSVGDISLELFPDKAPITVANFLSYVDDGFYDGTVFHRVIKGFMIQGGGYDKAYKKKPTKAPIRNEADNGLTNDVGTVAMARTKIVDSATSQFFINTVDNTFLNHRERTPAGYGYAVFGRVVSGMDTVKAIESSPTSRGGAFRDAPVEPVVIEKASRKKR